MNKQQAKAKASGLKPNENYHTELTKAVEDASKSFIEEVSRNMNKLGMEYKNDIQININSEGVTIIIPDYIEYVDKGVNGLKQKYGSPYSRKSKMVPISVIKEWMGENGIPTNQGIEFAIQKSLQDKGMKPRQIYSKDAFNNLVKNIEEMVAKAIESSFEGEIESGI